MRVSVDGVSTPVAVELDRVGGIEMAVVLASHDHRLLEPLT